MNFSRLRPREGRFRFGFSLNYSVSKAHFQGFDHDFGSDKSQRFYGYGQMFLGIPYATAPLREKRFTVSSKFSANCSSKYGKLSFHFFNRIPAFRTLENIKIAVFHADFL